MSISAPVALEGNGHVRHLVWFHTAFLGDLILATAGMELAAKTFSQVSQWLITTPLGAKALGGLPYLRGIYAINKRTNPFTTARGIREFLGNNLGDSWTDSGILIQAHRSHRSSLVALGIGMKRVTYRQTAWNIGAIAKVDRLLLFHEAQRIAMLLEAFGTSRVQTLQARPKLYPRYWRGQGEWRYLDGAVGLAPGSQWGTKRWPKESFKVLVGNILSKKDAKVVLLGSQDEVSLAEDIQSSYQRDSRLMSLVGKTQVDDLPDIVAQLSALVSNDSAFVHYGSALDIPTVALFGPTVPAMGFAPLAPKSQALGIDLSCRPCSLHGPEICPKGHFRCMKNLSPDLVGQVLQEIIP